MKTPLISAIKHNAKARKVRFCMPGHKGLSKGNKLYASAFFDITELDYSDNLLFADSVIKQSERLTADGMGAYRTFYLTTGATTGNLISALIVKEFGTEVLVERASHNSVYNAIGIAGLNPHFIENEIKDGIPAPITLDAVKKAYFKGAIALFLTSPNYFGNVAQMAEICEFAHSKGMIVVCDSAHGAHFAYSDLLPPPAHAFADLTVASAHKTLPVYTGGAYLHASNDDLSARVERIRRVVHTTSPSYIITCSLDYSQAVMNERGKAQYNKLFDAINELKKCSPYKVEKTDDFTRISLISQNGEALMKALNNHGFEVEFAYGKRCVLIASPFDISAVKKLGNALKKIHLDAKEFQPLSYTQPDVVVPYQTAFNAPGEYVAIKDAIGRVSGALLGLYPPGIPLVHYGQVITKDVINLIDKFPSSVYGLANGMVYVLK